MLYIIVTLPCQNLTLPSRNVTLLCRIPWYNTKLSHFSGRISKCGPPQNSIVLPVGGERISQCHVTAYRHLRLTTEDQNIVDKVGSVLTLHSNLTQSEDWWDFNSGPRRYVPMTTTVGSRWQEEALLTHVYIAMWVYIGETGGGNSCGWMSSQCWLEAGSSLGMDLLVFMVVKLVLGMFILLIGSWPFVEVLLV